jgi:hypothetical protein
VICAATISACQRYRYTLTRRWAASGDAFFPDPPLVVIMLNPSTADGMKDDPTIRKCIGFAKREQRSGLVVVNLFAWRATDPRDLWSAHDRGEDVVGPENDEAIREAIRCDGPTSGWLDPGVGDVVVAWGAHASDKRARERVSAVLLLIRAEWRGARSWGVSGDGSPRHPLMLPYSTRLEPWRPREER